MVSHMVSLILDLEISTFTAPDGPRTSWLTGLSPLLPLSPLLVSPPHREVAPPDPMPSSSMVSFQNSANSLLKYVTSPTGFRYSQCGMNELCMASR